MMRRIKQLLTLCLVLFVAVHIARLLLPLPDIENRPRTEALEPSADSRIARSLNDAMAENPGQSGLIALPSGHDALASRLELADAAEHSIDAQYYIWKADAAGLMLLDALRRAADRGVVVRLLLDDNGIGELEPILSDIDAHENIDIRLYNPSRVRSPKALGFVLEPMRMNRRMHNKSFTIDGQITIVGGRNIANEYFDVGDITQFFDLDVLAAGTIVPDVTAAFDNYWNSGSVYDVADLIDAEKHSARLDDLVDSLKDDPVKKQIDIEREASVSRYLAGEKPMEWSTVSLMVDNPIKGLGEADPDELMFHAISDIFGTADKRLDLVSAYFIPGKAGTRRLVELAESGIAVRIFTNALTTTDVAMVHAGYIKYRKQLLEAGIVLYELKRPPESDGEQDLQIQPLGISGGSLHAKTFAIDDDRQFIGSFNFDPRSALLNTEMGFIIDSSSFAERTHRQFDETLKGRAYKPRLTETGDLLWDEMLADGSTITHTHEPGTNAFTRAQLTVLGWLPIEWML